MRLLLLSLAILSVALASAELIDFMDEPEYQEVQGFVGTHPIPAKLPKIEFSEKLQDSLLAEFAEHLRRRESRLYRTPLLSKYEKQQMRFSRNAHHLHVAEQLGIDHGTQHGEASLLCLDAATPYYVEFDCQARLTDDALASLDIVGRAFHKALAADGLPLVRYAISSAYRSAAYQAKLRRINRNATRTTSSHEFGTTYDITYRRFYGSTDVTTDPYCFRLDPRMRGANFDRLRAQISATEQAWTRKMAEKYASRYAAVLGRTLTQLERQGTLLVLREWRQPCYHITVAREFGGA